MGWYGLPFKCVLLSKLVSGNDPEELVSGWEGGEVGM